MDELDLIQEAVVNWESLDEVAEVETWELCAGAEEERIYLSRILPQGGERAVYIEMRAVSGVSGSLDRVPYGAKPVSWSRPGFSLN
ncbi:MAG: hypothetical protein OYI31_00165 [Chloroflexota bacterium]|nr:hypothetical protein [Chloroflexota bacterium]MDE2941492.1 hypothetical protein [Chloroflexota bacterium]MDE3266870.1 hypothetical protein [Chloroflexota bacterium]